MTLLVDLCFKKDSLSRYEFVEPIRKAVSREHECTVIHRSELSAEILAGADRVILCGTALKDNGYMEELDRFQLLKGLGVPILGICAGMQVLSMLYGGNVYKWTSIGLHNIDILYESFLLGGLRTMEGYHLHNYGAEAPINFRLIAVDGQHTLAFESRDEKIYGILFHPEVRNLWVIENFLAI
ncbi:MAG: gamma-glutamyl-gamma-aminobutyrate hydrolase family protein [Candidatus Methanofastidiosa archaeon]|nr:gamma-glutamyl-gamma-aminobutyrate hydrolase family protein [Candidatus Methanofastidiosa archaeon]